MPDKTRTGLNQTNEWCCELARRTGIVTKRECRGGTETDKAPRSRILPPGMRPEMRFR